MQVHPNGDNLSPARKNKSFFNTKDQFSATDHRSMKRILRPHRAILATLFLMATASVLAPASLTAFAGEAAAGGPSTGTDPHASISCTLCHGRSAVRALAVSDHDGPDPRSRACRECHRDLDRGAGLGFHGPASADCAGCHSFHEEGRLKTAVGDVRGGGLRLARAVPGHCAACHTDGAALGNLSPAHRTAAGLYHRDAATLEHQSPSQGCLNCHAAGSGSPWLQATEGQELTFNLHATHPLGVEVVAGSGLDERKLRQELDPRLRLFAGRLECQTCHDLTAGTADLLVAFEQPHDLCLGCHELRNSQPPQPRRALMATMMAVE